MIVIVIQCILFSILYTTLVYSCLLNVRSSRRPVYSEIPQTPFNSPCMKSSIKRSSLSPKTDDIMDDFDVL